MAASSSSSSSPALHDKLFLVSWNVAGWTTTASAIRSNFGTLDVFLQHLKADILCIQEAKVTRKRLDQDEVASGATDRPGYPIPGWESFWATPNDGSSFNGVTTFAKSGLTLGVDAKPLRVEAFDKEGRCIVTYHSHFSLFNVYVPNAQQGQRQDKKTQFQVALLQAMRRVRRERNLPVILVGDLNLTYRVEDCHFLNRKILLPPLAKAMQLRRGGQLLSNNNNNNSNNTTEGTAKNDDDDDAIRSVRETITDEEWESIDYLLPFIVSHLKSKCISSNININAQTTTSSPLPSDNTLPMDGFTLYKLATDTDTPYVWTESLVRGAAGVTSLHNSHVFVVSECFGIPCHSPLDGSFVRRQLIGEDGMIDTLLFGTRYGCPRADDEGGSNSGGSAAGGSSGALDKKATHCSVVVGAQRRDHKDGAALLPLPPPLPFTCWDQYRNRRYENEGNRIDYIFVDESLEGHIVTTSTTRSRSGDVVGMPSSISSPSVLPLVRGNSADSWKFRPVLSEYCGDDKLASLRRVTAGGVYTPAPMDGSGMERLKDAHKWLQFDNLPETGMYLSPPQYSDHIGVCLFLSDVALRSRPQGTQVDDPHQAMHRRRSANLLDMFAKKQKQQQPSSSSAAPPLPVPPPALSVVRGETAEDPLSSPVGVAVAGGGGGGGDDAVAVTTSLKKRQREEVIDVDSL